GKANVAEKKSYIKGIQRNIRKLEEECHHKQNIGANSLLLQKVYQERIERYRKVFQKHKESYWQNPLAKQLLMIQSEKEELESRIKACEDQITAKEKALQDLRGQTLSIENPLESISGLLTAAESHRQSASQAEDDHQSPLDISSLHLSQDGHEKQGEGIEEHLEKTFAHPHHKETQTVTCGHTQRQWMKCTLQTRRRGVRDGGGEGGEGERTEGGEEQPTSFITEEEENEGMGAAFSPQTPARMKAVSSTPTFSL
ncbi:unnamed protein product, partial [Coregonus sp. 'balchen']